MKNLLVFFLCAVISFSCTKTQVSLTKNKLAGTWILKQITGGLAGIDSIPTDNITIKFEPGENYTSTFNNVITSTGNYTVTKAGEPGYYYSETLLNLFSDNGNITYGASLHNDSLFLSEGCCDQFNYMYVKQK